MRHLIYILLFITIPLSGQYVGKHSGLFTVHEGDIVMVHTDNIPSTPAAPPPSDFDGTIYKSVSFAELVPDQNTDARAKVFLGSNSAFRYIDSDSLWRDSTVVVTNDASATDTVWQVMIGGAPWNGTYTGSSWEGDIEINGINDNDDTVTAINLSFYVKLIDWEWGTGGKTIGLGGNDHDGSVPPSGGQWGPTCSECGEGAYYAVDRGFTTTGNYELEAYTGLGIYAYHQGVNWSGKPCDCPATAGKVYGSSYGFYRDSSYNLSVDWTKWNKITHRIILNTGDNYDGILEWALNDTIRVSKTNMRFRRSGYSIYIDRYKFDNFSGGATPAWSGNITVQYDDVLLWREDKRDEYGYGVVMTNVPDMATPNTN